MQPNTEITLDSHFEQFIAQQINEGHYASTNEAVLAGLRLLEQREAQREALRQALIEGEASGKATAYSLEDVLRELDSERAS